MLRIGYGHAKLYVLMPMLSEVFLSSSHEIRLCFAVEPLFITRIYHT